MKSAVEKTHKTVHRHVKEFEKKLGAGVQNVLNANIEDWTTEGGEGVWDKIVAHQVDIQPFITEESLKVRFRILIFKA